MDEALTPAAPPPADPTGAGAAVKPVPQRPAITTLQRRADFLRAASSRRQGTAGFLLQARRRAAAEPVPPGTVRIGYTCSKKLGNAVARNRAKRRLRALARSMMPQLARPGWDYVLVGRPEATATRDFTDLQSDLRRAIARVHDAAEPAPSATGDAPRRRGGR